MLLSVVCYISGELPYGRCIPVAGTEGGDGVSPDCETVGVPHHLFCSSLTPCHTGQPLGELDTCLETRASTLFEIQTMPVLNYDYLEFEPL